MVLWDHFGFVAALQLRFYSDQAKDFSAPAYGSGCYGGGVVGKEPMPDFRTRIRVLVLALATSACCLPMLQKARSRKAHMQASMMFTSNHSIIKAGVKGAG